MNTSDNKWPTNYKNFNVAYVPKLVLASTTPTTVTLSWTYCFPAASYNLYKDGTLLINVIGLTSTVTVSSGTYNFFVVAVVTNAVSGPSNVLTVTPS